MIYVSFLWTIHDSDSDENYLCPLIILYFMYYFKNNEFKYKQTIIFPILKVYLNTLYFKLN